MQKHRLNPNIYRSERMSLDKSYFGIEYIQAL